MLAESSKLKDSEKLGVRSEEKKIKDYPSRGYCKE